MAESQIAGLFMTPEMYQRQQMQADRQRAAEYAQLAPEQRAAMGFFSAGQGLGRAAGTLLGAQDPQLQRITEQQQMLQGLDVADPESLMEAARRASQAGNVPLAMQLAGRAQEVNANAALISQRERANNPLQAFIASGKYTPASIAAFAQSNNPADLVLATPERQPQSFGPDREAVSLELFDKPYANLAPEERTQVNAELKKPAAAPSFGAEREAIAVAEFGNTFANLTQPQQRRVIELADARATSTARASAPTVVLPAQARAENAYSAQVGKDIATRDISTIDAASAVAQTLPKMYETRRLIETGNLNTGILAEVQQVIDRARTKFGDDKKAGKRVTDTEYLNSLLGSDVFPQISALGIGARGLDTPAEREFLRQVITGTIQMDRETLKRMINFRINAAEKAVDGYNTRLNAGEFEQFKRTTGRALAPIAVNRPPAANDPLGVRPK